MKDFKLITGDIGDDSFCAESDEVKRRKKNIINFATYCRCSTLMQPMSNADQKSALDTYASKSSFINILDDQRYVDEATTGRNTLSRKAFKRLMKIATAPEGAPFEGILVESTSRFGRNAAQVLTRIKLLKYHGIRVIFVQQALDSFDSKTELVLTIMAGMDEEASKTIAANTIRGQIGQIGRKFSPGINLFGFESIPEYSKEKYKYGVPMRNGNKVVIVHAEADIVREIYKMRIERGMSCQAIANELNLRLDVSSDDESSE